MHSTQNIYSKLGLVLLKFILDFVELVELISNVNNKLLFKSIKPKRNQNEKTFCGFEGF